MALPTGIISSSLLAFLLPPTDSSENIPIEEGAQQNSAHPVGVDHTEGKPPEEVVEHGFLRPIQPPLLEWTVF